MDFIKVFVGNSHQDALIVKEILEDHQILTMMPNEHVSGVVPYYSLATGGFSVLVSEADFIQAAELLNSLQIKVENSRLLENLEELKKTKVLEICPDCGNLSVEIVTKNRKGLIVALFLLFGIPINAKKSYRYCHICGLVQKIKINKDTPVSGQI